MTASLPIRIESSQSRSPLHAAAAGARACVFALVLVMTVACGNYGGGDEGATTAAAAGGGGSGSGAGAGSGATTAESIAAFEQTAYPLLTQYCESCHAGAGPGSPHISHPNVATAYDAVVSSQKVNLANPSASRLVRRLATDFHHCWSDCMMDGAEMQAAIAQWAVLVDFSGGSGTVAAGSIGSSELTLDDGVEEVQGERYEQHIIALWEFKEGVGEVAYDTSGVSPAMDLSIEGAEWMSNYGLSFDNGRAIASEAASRKLYDRIADPGRGTQQFSMEAWVIPANVTQEGPARIVSYSRGTGARNFTLGQVLYNYDFRNRNIDVDISDNGEPSLRTYDADQDLQATLQHVVITYDQFRGRRIYVNGTFTDDMDEQAVTRLWNWDPGHFFVLGNETGRNRPWEGRIQLVAIYDHALSDAQIRRNFDAGIGKKLRMRFDVSQWAGIGSLVELQVSQLDQFSYLFCTPTFVGAGPGGVRVKNIRILVNGQAPASGQAFTNIDTMVTGSSQVLSSQCSVIAVDQGPAVDRFSLEFEILGGFSNVIVVGPPPPTPPVTPTLGAMPDEGLRDFHRISETMAAVTGVSPNAAAVQSTFQDVEQQLPGTYDLRTFSSSQQVGVAKLALEYCDQMVETPALRDAVFGPGFGWNAPVATALAGQAERDVIIDGLVSKMVGTNVANQPDRTEIAPVLNNLFDMLTQNCGVMLCDAVRTRSVVKAACSAVLASAAVTIH